MSTSIEKKIKMIYCLEVWKLIHMSTTHSVSGNCSEVIAECENNTHQVKKKTMKKCCKPKPHLRKNHSASETILWVSSK